MRLKVKKILTAGVTFCAALGIGTIMQYGDALASRIGGDTDDAPSAMVTPPVAASAPVQVRAATVATPVPAGPTDSRMAAIGDLPVETPAPMLTQPIMPDPVSASVTVDVPVAAPDDVPMMVPDTPVLPEPATEEVVCNPTMDAQIQPIAMVKVTLSDACRPDTVVTIHHRGMMFQELTDANGLLQVTIPALSSDALFVADFGSGQGVSASVAVPQLKQFHRAVLQWQGDSQVELHALEFGAAYFEEGHIWNGSTGSLEAAEYGQGGVLTRLGNVAISDAFMAEVYTFPSGANARDGSVLLSVEAEVSDRNCGRDVAAQSLQVGPDALTDATDLVMTMPGCDAVGEFLVLNNMFEDLTLAAK
ncbi:hypothetical protein [Loktanella sp. SALINAS62]|uniref:hypothetical protein n=1 Tax=Loktanella sp. SALINAS62 TaxID=2706124 RepID=UPI001B8B6959|nr:hypothetical protein [Loktanella sp. SALINAS62]MBS1302493.1 hypothetical protein [Loktanella sp. SALINAS62]